MTEILKSWFPRLLGHGFWVTLASQVGALGYAFVLWPEKLFGAATRYLTDNQRDVMQGDPEAVLQVREAQYLTFFATVAWALLLILFLLILRVLLG